MKTSRIAGTCLAVALLLGTGCSREKPQQPAAQHDLLSAATEFVNRLAQGDSAGAVLNFDPVMSQAMPEAKMRETWQSLTGQVGAFKKLLGKRATQEGGFDVVFITCEFERSVLDVKVVFQRQGKISGLWFLPGQRSASDAGAVKPPETVRETEVRIGAAPWTLPGTLTLPAKGAGPWPAVVLVHGSGPGDRDETVGANRPFRDLAWGLAIKGVAVLRYDKATKVFPDRFRAMRGMTVKEETMDDAIQAVALLRTSSGVDGNRIFVAGHSLGGTLAPRIGQADPRIAGIIILAGSTRPMEELMVEQTRYILSLDGDLTADDQKRIAALEMEVSKVRKLTDSDASSTATVLGAPPSYWLDLRRYNPAAAAAQLKQPLLILQGGRDYQVTTADFDGWKQELTALTNVTFRLYPALNHLLVAGEGKSSPAEYHRPGSVDKEVINDISAWILRQ